MKNLPYYGHAGKWRVGHEGIFDAAGNAVYHAPSPSQIPGLISDLISYINKDTDENPLIKAVLSHLIFEKIHPFVDGNGRVGRLLQLAVLSLSGYGMKGMVVAEEIVDKKRQLYYQAISDSVGDDATEFIEILLEFMVEATNNAKDKMVAGKKFTRTDMLPLRRQELLQIVRDHGTVTLDFLHRRFLNVDDRLLRYDLKQLINAGFITKIGRTKGVIYTPKSSNPEI
jgi:Fic family protein